MTTPSPAESEDARRAAYREAIEKIGDAFFIIDRNLAFAEVNAALCQLLARPQEALVGQSPLAVVTAADAALMRERIATMQSGERRSNQYHVVRPDGSVVPVLVRAIMHRDAEGKLQDLIGFVTDLSPIESVNQRLADSERELRAVLDNMIDVYYRTDLEGVIVSGSRSCEQLLGWTLEELLGRKMTDLYVDPSERTRFLQLLQAQGGQVRHFEARLRRRNGSEVWVSTNARFHRAPDGSIAGVEGTVRDVTELRRAKADIEFLAHHDPLTRLPNRWHLRARLEDTIAGRREADRAFALLFVDLDEFKQVNDQHGHAAGDLVLQEVARRLTAAVRTGDIVCRHGGDEFVVALPGVQAQAQAAAVVEQIERTVAQPIAVAGRQVRVSCSTGIAIYPEDGADYDALLRKADVHMYRAKRRAA